MMSQIEISPEYMLSSNYRFFYLLDLAMWNSFIIYTMSGGTKSPLMYRLAIIEKYHFANMKPKAGWPSVTPTLLRLMIITFQTTFHPQKESKYHRTVRSV